MINILFLRKNGSLDFTNLIKVVSGYVFFIFVSNFGSLILNIYLDSFYNLRKDEFFIRCCYLKRLQSFFCFYVFSTCFCWSAVFDIIGYNYEIKKKIKKNLLKLDLGFSKYKILLYFPYYVFILGRKRNFSLFCLSLNLFYVIVYYMRRIRDLFPYKLRGLVSTLVKRLKLKSGKKTRYN